MTNADKEQFSNVIGALAVTFGKEASTALMLGYWMGLKDLDVVQIEAAAEKAIQACRFMPKPVELRELATGTSPESRAVLAWNALNDAVSIGSYKSVDFDDPLINAVVRTNGGWPAILDKSPDEWDKWFRQSFIKDYMTFYRNGINGDVCRPLPGLSQSGEHDVIGHDGTLTTINLEGPVKIKTGLPALPSSVVPQLGKRRDDLPLVEMKKV